MNSSIENALEKLSGITPAGTDGFYYQGQELANKKCTEVAAFKGINTLHKLYAVLRQTWKSDTAYRSCQTEWIPTDPSYGQCAITAMLVYDMFGGSIHRIRVNGGGTHYFNKIDGHYVDLTREQFDLYDIPITTDDISAIISRYLLFTQHINLNATDTMNGLQYIFLNDIDKENEYYKH